ncbi:MAG: tetratricopeptide repeat protein [Tannerellaceae bacterium]|jgi:tetratricopeptide (TPR) repeat protein|nr:tetratricopeptide repeat protein [Tannerellaceae bacterium]
MRRLVLFVLLLLAGQLYAQEEEVGEQRIEYLLSKAEEMLKINPTRAVYYANLAIVEAQKTDDKNHIAMGQAILGEAYMNQEDYDMGFEALTLAMEVCPPDSSRLQAYIYVHLSASYQKMRDLDKAFTYVDKAIDIYKALNDSLNLARCYNSRGLTYIHLPDNERAEENFKAALAINRSLGNVRAVSANLNNLCLYEGDTEEKISLLREAIAINDSLGNTWSLGENYNNLGTQYYYAHDYAQALEALQLAMEYARSENAQELICDNYRYSSWIYEAQKNYRLAYDNLLKLYRMEQELSVGDEMRQMELNITQKRLRVKEQAMLLQEQAFQIKSLRMQGYIVFLVAGAILLILLYIGFHYRHRKQLQILEARKKLDEQEKELIEQELTHLAFFIRSRNDMLAHIQAMVKEGYKLSGAEIERHLRSIHTYISQFNAQNTEIELLIDQVNAKFIDKLSQLHPDLSRNEQRLASLLRIGLSTKEIAAIISSTPKTVNMARYRLRKRLGLETDESLTAYMKSIGL